ncbi:sensor domain-containing diguanylate cyclase [Kineosporia sp. NBRC 101731]|uniref:sensor domain-containing diguanylate cyclase n=1 Tax=Kineosporia sp. NBRC 101731 TaxID=3032199 RepID=UPI0024A22538|nr:sensor domain-containing diguanylate cyclase [Kineosporia sp. NBRC 101731]GLY29195.1 hypothetical protein Kisp02_25600 [Kineosporia sp. NBRC 101731]
MADQVGEVRGPPLPSRRTSQVVAVLVAAGLAVLLRLAGVEFLMHSSEEGPVWWPLAGVGAVALLLSRRWLWGPIVAGLAIGLTVAAAMTGFSLNAVAGAVGGVCETGLTAAFIGRFLPERRTAGHRGQMMLVVLCALAGTTVASVAFAAVIGVGGGEVDRLWWQFARSHLLGLCVTASALLAQQVRHPAQILAGLRDHRTNLEWALQLLVLGAVCGAVFLTHQRVISSSIIALPLIWSCLRLGPLRTAVGQALAAVIMTVGTLHGFGRVAALDRSGEIVIALQDSILNLTLITLVVAVVAQARDRAFAVIHDRTRDLNSAERMARLGSTRWEPGAREVVWSDGLFALLGTSPADTTPGLPAMLAAVHPQDRGRLQQEMVTISQDGRRRTTEYRIVRPDGEVRDVLSYAAAERGANGRIRQVFATLQDITEAKAAAAEVARAHDELAAVLDAVTGVAIIGADPATNVIQFFNRGAENLFGYTAQEVVGRFRVHDLHDPDELADLTADGTSLGQEVDKSVASRGLHGRQWTFIRQDGTRFPGQLTVSAQEAPDGAQQARIGVVTDLSRVLQVQEELSESQDRFRLAFDGAPVGMAMVALDSDDPGAIFHVNSAFCELTGRTEDELLALRIDALLMDDGEAEDSRRNVAELLHGVIETITTERRIVRPDGQEQWGRVSTSAVRPPGDGRGPYLICLVEDITARKELTERLHHDATHDPLTGLPNRLHLHRQLEQTLADRRKSAVAVLYLDLDGFKAVNDTQGHGAGDDLLIQVADRIAASVRSTDVVARLGGDEFAVLCPGLGDEEIALQIGHAILAELTREFDLGSCTVRVGASIGVAMEGDGDTGPALLHAADVAMYTAKREGKGRVRRYMPGVGAGPSSAGPPGTP